MKEFIIRFKSDHRVLRVNYIILSLVPLCLPLSVFFFSPDLTKDGAVVEVAVVLAGMAVEDGEAGIETETAEAVGIAAARLCQDPWRDPEHA